MGARMLMRTRVIAGCRRQAERQAEQAERLFGWAWPLRQCAPLLAAGGRQGASFAALRQQAEPLPIAMATAMLLRVLDNHGDCHAAARA